MIIIDSSSIPDSFNILGEMKTADISMEYFPCVFILSTHGRDYVINGIIFFFFFSIFYFPIETNLYFLNFCWQGKTSLILLHFAVYSGENHQNENCMLKYC